MSDQYEDLGLFGRRPFIALEKPGLHDDGIRAEVRIIEGYGVIDSSVRTRNANDGLEEVDKGWKVFFYKGTKFTESAYVNSKKLAKVLQKAEEDHTPLFFRIEVQRKAGIDRSLPISEVFPEGDKDAVRENGARRLAAIRFSEDEDWVVDEQTALTDPNNLFDNNSSAVIIRGQVNPGSIAAGVPASMMFFLYEQAHKNGVEKPDTEALRAFTPRVLAVCNKIQKDIGRTSSVDYGSNLHLRVRAIVYPVIENLHPLTEDVLMDEKVTQKWLRSLYKKALEVQKWSVSVVKEQYGITDDEEE